MARARARIEPSRSGGTAAHGRFQVGHMRALAVPRASGAPEPQRRGAAAACCRGCKRARHRHGCPLVGLRLRGGRCCHGEVSGLDPWRPPTQRSVGWPRHGRVPMCALVSGPPWSRPGFSPLPRRFVREGTGRRAVPLYYLNLGDRTPRPGGGLIVTVARPPGSRGMAAVR
jgi:hypothetical protein